MPTVVGFLPNVVEGDVYTFKGQVVQHPRYGKQLKAETFEKNYLKLKKPLLVTYQVIYLKASVKRLKTL